MKPKILISLLVALWLILPGSAEARPVHYFDCKDCHTASLDLYSLGNTNLCLKCHKDSPPAVTYNDLTTGHKPNGLFHPNEASDALGSATAVGMSPTLQTSHFWASKKDNIPAAGALPPSKTLYTSRYGISTGKVTCTRCHDPHLPITTDPKLLRMSAAGDLICFDCHRPWKLSNNQGRETHPIVADYAAVATAQPTKYQSSVTNVGQGGVQLVSGGVTCTSCHATHFADSHSDSPDGRDNRAGLLTGDGKLLRSDGPKRTGADAAATAQLRSNLCQACHTYKTHGGVNVIGCLDCHSGHVYNNGDPNFFVLRGSIDSVYVPKNSAVGPVNSLQFKSATAEWMNAGGTGYCQSCHNLGAEHNGFSAGTSAANSCGECHYHGHAASSFTASCADCHGTPPTANLAAPAAGGYAKSGALDYSTSGVYKDESLTPHGSHAGGSDYNFACDVCHQGKSHATGTFQEVFKAGNIHPLASGSGATAPSYNGAGSGTCSAVYCHSNGGARGAAPVAAPGSEWANGAWASGKDVISGKPPADRCQSCHGNDSASMTARGNSASHQKHLAKGYGCNVCHQSTAATATALAVGAIGTTHVNGQGDVSFDTGYELSVGRPLGTGSYASAAGTCSTYCHTNGAGTPSSPDWDLAASGACGTCHSVTPTSGSHAAHLNAAGANLACDSCHGAGAVSGSHSGHVNGTIDRLTQAASCNSCHGIDGAEVAPVWGNVASVNCDSCHGGSATTSYTDRSAVVRTAAAKTAYASAGHGKAGVAQGCTACHSTASDADHMGAGATTRLKPVNGQSYAAANPTAFCGACHDGGSGNETNHYATTGASIDGSKCNGCHDPHGVSGYDAMVRSSIGGRAVAAFASKADRASYANASFDGVCQVCHVAADVNHFNQTTFTVTEHGGSQVCTDCHSHAAGTAFELSCSSCHGGGTVGSTSGKKNFWPDGSTAHAANQAGEHTVHMQQLIARAGHASVDAFLNNATNAQQKALCEYCHSAVASDDDHMSAGSAEVFVATLAGTPTRFAKRIWDGTADADAAYAAGSCSAVDCHNGKTTPAGYLWYDGGSSACIMCHNGTTGASGIPNSGSHAAHLDKSGFNVYYSLNRIGCPDCHSNTVAAAWTGNSAPSADHINGVRNVAGSRSLTYAAQSCGTNSCHNNGKNLAPAEAVTWGAANSNGCSSCHTHSAEGHAPHFDAAFNQTHMSSGAMGGFNCTPCHSNNQVGSSHFNGSVSFSAGINYSGNVDVAVADNYGTCNTTTCHQTGKGVAVVTPTWNRTPQAADNCTLCHAAIPATGSHAKHVATAPTTPWTTAYGLATNLTTASTYDFRCGNCHGTSIANHINGSVSLGAVGFNSGAKTCAASYCHSDGNGSFVASPAWGATPAGDGCALCHANSPTTNAHKAHVIGFHSKEIYSGLTGFLPVRDADPKDAGLTGSIDQLRGHGGNLIAGDNTSLTTSTTLNCHICHQDTVTVAYNANGDDCKGCHVATPNPNAADKLAGNAAMEIADKRKHPNNVKEVRFIDEKIRSKAQIREKLSAVPELGNNWTRVGGYKAASGTSYDESPDTLANLAKPVGQGGLGGFDPATKTCQISCHLWEAGRVDKIPAKWNGGAIMCIDCHTRLPQ